MNNSAGSPHYNSPLRARQKEQTHDLILSAVATILRGSDLAAVTIAEVARVAEVTERTVYRHFTTRDDLLNAFWKWQLQKSGGAMVIEPRSVDELLDNIKRLFASLDADEGVIRAVLSSAEGREMRRGANRTRLEHMSRFVAAYAPDLPERDRSNIASGIVSVCSVLSWLFMRDNCGFDGARAGEAAALSVQLLLEGGKARAAAVRAAR
jgi:AcrR family transcriptional regulator